MTTPADYKRAAETLRDYPLPDEALDLAIALCERMAAGELVERSAEQEAAQTKLAKVELLLSEWRQTSPKRVAEGKCGTDREFMTDDLEDALR